LHYKNLLIDEQLFVQRFQTLEAPEQILDFQGLDGEFHGRRVFPILHAPRTTDI
jgi:hypothetical protein